MVRLFRAAFRKGQWDRALNYSSRLPRPRPWVSAVCGLGLVTAAACLAANFAFKGGGGAARSHSGLKEARVNDAWSHAAVSPLASSRHLLSTTDNLTYYDKYCNRLNSSSKSSHISWESCDFEKATNSIAGWIVLYIVITLIIFVALAIVCDDFFVPSLEVISEKLSLSEDVAGATFMAAGSSAPELFSSIAAVTFDSDAGVGTIAGSAVFNLLVIISLTAAFAGKVLHLDWRPLARDSVWYMISIAYFIVMVSDTLIQIWEACVLLVLYIIYIIIMVFNQRLMNGLSKLEQACCCNKVEPSESAVADLDEQTEGSRVTLEKRQFRHDRRNSVMGSLRNSRASLRDSKTSLRGGEQQQGGGRTPNSAVPMTSNGTAGKTVSTHAVVLQYSDFQTTSNDDLKKAADDKDKNKDKNKDKDKDKDEDEDKDKEKEEEEEEPRMHWCCSCCPDIRGAPPEKEESMNCVNWLVFVLKWIIFVVAFPFILLFSLTIPECSREDLKKYFLVSFIVSVLWIAGLSFAMVTVVARMGCLMGIDTFVMSLVVLAAGTSIPDLLSSIIVARDGFGDMAVSNAIGSNVFDIDLGLGLPFLIRLCISAADPLDMFSDDERREQCEGRMYVVPHVKFGAILGGLLVVCMIVIVIARFRLGKIIGVTFFVMYILFLAYAFVQEFVCSYNC